MNNMSMIGNVQWMICESVGFQHPQKKKISWCVSSQPHNFRVITQEHGLIEQVKVNLDLTKLLNV